MNQQQQHYQPIYYNNNNNSNNNNRLPLTPNSISPPSLIESSSSTRGDCSLTEVAVSSKNDQQPSESLSDYPQEITWLFFRDNKWVPFQSNNHYKIEQAFTLGGIYVDIKDLNFPHLKSIRVFPTRMYLSYLEIIVSRSELD